MKRLRSRKPAVAPRAGALSQVSELRQALEEQTRRSKALSAQLESVSRRQDDLQTALRQSHELALCRQDEIQTGLYDLRDSLAALQERSPIPAAAGSGPQSGKDYDYRQLVRRIREAVRTHLPRDGRIIVVSKGDSELLDLYGRPAWHFPQTKDGAYAGYYPADSGAAIAHLEALRSRGGDFLLIPRTALWWLDHYARFAQHVERRYRATVRQEEIGVIFALGEPAVSGPVACWKKFEDLIAAYRSYWGRDPAILDWKSGLDLAAGFPQYTVFSPPTDDDVLPYLDRSIDVVAISSADNSRADEARRTAAAAVVNVTPAGNDGAAGFNFEVNWQLQGIEVAGPTVSIIVPSYNGITYTESLLVTLKETLPRTFTGEIIIVDDGSTDNTPERLKRLAQEDTRIGVVRNRSKSGFVSSCNRGAKAARGDILVFLNNDTLALPGWLPPVLQTFRDHPDAGVVGGKLIYPEGRLQEAGGVLFSDGSAANFGKWDCAVDGPLYNYVREVDYVSGAFLATRRSLFVESGGFDTRFRPGYYEDADYCLRQREMGYRVYYQPASAVVHHEGATAGTDLSQGAKHYQEVNRAKFVRKWRRALKRQPLPPRRLDLAAWYALAARAEPDGGPNR